MTAVYRRHLPKFWNWQTFRASLTNMTTVIEGRSVSCTQGEVAAVAEAAAVDVAAAVAEVAVVEEEVEDDLTTFPKKRWIF